MSAEHLSFSEKRLPQDVPGFAYIHMTKVTSRLRVPCSKTKMTHQVVKSEGIVMSLRATKKRIEHIFLSYLLIHTYILIECESMYLHHV